jgi:phosphocarrier protein
MFYVHAFAKHQSSDHLMPSTSNIQWRAVTIVNEMGMHARSAAKVAEVAQEARDNVWLEFGAEQVDDILMLGAAKGDEVIIRIEQAADVDILNRIAALIDDGFGE